MALKQQAQDLFQTYLYGQRGQQRRQKGPQHILQQQRAHRHDRLLAEVAIGPLASRAQGGGLLREFRLCALGVFELVFQGHQRALALLQTSAMPLGLRLGHLGLLGRDRLGLLVHPLMSGLQGLCELRLLALMMPRMVLRP